MKRLVSIFMVILFCFAMTVPALAAERYEFYHAPAVLPEFNRLEDAPFFVSESSVGNGTYVLTLYGYGGEVFSSEPFVIEHNLIDEEFGALGCFFDLIFFGAAGSISLSCALCLFPDGGTGFGVVGSDGAIVEVLSSVEYIVLNSVDQGLHDVITGDMMLGALDQLVSLLPVVLAVIVGCVGLRKAIAWLQTVMRSS